MAETWLRAVLQIRTSNNDGLVQLEIETVSGESCIMIDMLPADALAAADRLRLMAQPLLEKNDG